jgi:hypothetical protein
MGVFSRILGSLSEESGPSAQFHVASPEKRSRYEGLLVKRFVDDLEREVSKLGGSR